MPDIVPTAQIRLREAVAGDMAQVAAIYAHHVRTGVASFEEVPPDGAEMARRHAAVTAAGMPYLVAEQDGRVVGYAYAARYRERTAYRYTVEDSVYVADGAARGGIGRTLLVALIERCTALGYRQMVAVIGDSANAGSIGLHASLGFRAAGVLPSVGFKLGRWVDSVIMTRALGEGDQAPPEG
ncbi:MAG: GNAT family N-acetyltransferase [Alphaproteobacteria bacterium]|nr:GNAT family N-acetyltransferase [Alphaproteobacteria bacterium]